MALGRNRQRIFVRGLGHFELIEKEPTAATVPSSAGWIKSATYRDIPDMQDVKSDTGYLINSLRKGQEVSIEAALEQTSIEEINLIRNASAKIYAARYRGKIPDRSVFQYFCIEAGVITSLVELPFEVNERLLPIKVRALNQSDITYVVPLSYVFEAADDIDTAEMDCWLTPRQALNTGTTKILDISGFGKHGTLNATTLWQTLLSHATEKFIRFDGTDDYITLGDQLDIIDSQSWGIAFWIDVKGADGALQEILSKKSADAHEDGYRIVRNTSNKIEVKISDGAASVTATGATSLITTSGWKHVAFIVDRANTAAQIYLNGVADGSPVNANTLASSLNAEDLLIGRFAGGYGQFDLGGLMHWQFESGTALTAAKVLALYNAEKAAFGL